MDLQKFYAKFNWFLDFFIPRSNHSFSSIHSYLTKTEIEAQVSSSLPLSKDAFNIFEQVYICSSYKNDLISNLIFRAKFNGELAIIPDFVELILNKAAKLSRPDLISFVPADPIRKLQRGYHIPFKIADLLGQKLNLNVVEMVTKIKSTKPQTKLDKQNRLQNLENVFEINPDILIEYDTEYSGTIWLIDDIITTMTTVITTAKLIKKNYPKASIIAIAIAG